MLLSAHSINSVAYESLASIARGEGGAIVRVPSMHFVNKEDFVR